MAELSPGALALLESPAARKIAAAWPGVPKHRSASMILDAWALAAGVARPVVEHLGPGLLDAGILRHDRTIHDTAVKFLNAAALAAAGRRRKQ